MEKEYYLCPICAYDKLDRPPVNWSICPQCGTEFEYDDFEISYNERVMRHHELRKQWIANGKKFWSKHKHG